LISQSVPQLGASNNGGLALARLSCIVQLFNYVEQNLIQQTVETKVNGNALQFELVQKEREFYSSFTPDLKPNHRLIIFHKSFPP